MSLGHVIQMMYRHGPLVNWWDGGNRGEKSIQDVKPHLQRGVPPYPSFFNSLHRRLFKQRQMGQMEKMYSPTTIEQGVEPRNDVAEIEDELERAVLDEESVDNAMLTVPDLLDYCDQEDEMMKKARTTYTYKTAQRLEDALELQKPLAGILVDDGGGTLSFYCLARTSKKKTGSPLGWRKISFLDSSGVTINGLWYTKITASTLSCMGCPRSLDEIKRISRMSAVAIPLHYVMGVGHEDANKFCVITNWWKPRQRNGRYFIPSLDVAAYREVPRHPSDTLVELMESSELNAPPLQAGETCSGTVEGVWPALAEEVRQVGIL